MNAFIGHFVTAAGVNAAERRRSRVAIWQRQAAFAHGVLYPQTDGRSLFLVATTPEAVSLLDSNPDEFLKRLEDRPHFDGGALREFVEYGPEIKFAFEKGKNRSRGLRSPGIARSVSGFAFPTGIPSSSTYD